LLVGVAHRCVSMIADLLAHHSTRTLILLIAAAFVASLARGFSGFGGALIFVPLASAAVGPQAAAPILLVIDGIAQLALLKNAWRQANRREVGIMAAGALVGIPLGAAILAYVDASTLRWAIVVLVVAMLALLISGWRYHGQPNVPTTLGVDVLLLSALAVPGYALGTFLGTRMFGLASDATFRRVCFVLIAAAAIVSLPVFDSVLH
jgi:uncharacterized membrane protein YfcA